MIPINKISHRCPSVSLNLANGLKKPEQVVLTVNKVTGRNHTHLVMGCRAEPMVHARKAGTSLKHV